MMIWMRSRGSPTKSSFAEICDSHPRKGFCDSGSGKNSNSRCALFGLKVRPSSQNFGTSVPSRYPTLASLEVGVRQARTLNCRNGSPSPSSGETQHDLLHHDDAPEVQLDPPVVQGVVEVRAPARAHVAVDDEVGVGGVGADEHAALGVLGGELEGVEGGVDVLAQEPGADRAVGGDLDGAADDVPGAPVGGAVGADLGRGDRVALLGESCVGEQECGGEKDSPPGRYRVE